jgi:hypothetical protein
MDKVELSETFLTTKDTKDFTKGTEVIAVVYASPSIAAPASFQAFQPPAIE